MTCVTKCLNGGTCSFNDTCICQACFIGGTCETNANIIQFSLTDLMHWDIQHTSIGSNFNLPEFIYTVIIALMLIAAVINNIICLQTFFLHEIRLTNCGIFQILYCFTGLIAIIGLQLRMLTMLVFDSLIQIDFYRYMACNIIPIIVITMGDIYLWLSALLAIEFVLLEWFNLNLYRSRKFAVISSIICFLLTSGSHIHELIFRHAQSVPNHPNSYTCSHVYPLPIDIMDKVFRTGHVLIPCIMHFVAIICILISMTHRILFIYCRHDYYRVFINECIRRKHFFIPPLIIILSNLPHLFLHLRDECEDVRDTAILRMHIAFNILVYLPPSITFFVYIYPSNSYMHQFMKTFIGRWLQRIFRKKENVSTIQLHIVPQKNLNSIIPSTS